MKHSIACIAIFLLSATAFAQSPDSTFKPGGRLQDRPHAVLGELAWNGLGGGLGVYYSHYFPGKPYVADFAVGLGVTGARIGGRYRHLFAPDKRTSPFLGAGLNYATGTGDADFDVESNHDTVVVHIRKTANLLLNLGLDLKANNGFVFVPSIGWGFDLMDHDYDVVSGVPKNSHRQMLRLMLKGGFQLSFITGWAF
jgi:hypothetical protein